MKNTPHTQILSKRHQSENRERTTSARCPEFHQHFQSAQITGGCGKSTKFEHPSFNDISKEYFADEEPRGFAIDSAIFATLTALAFLPIGHSLQAVVPFVHHLGLL